ncbi:M16 family metallopeptidase [Flavobacterium crassostreae]|uniref:Insulinase-like protein n=1 Tax=Flavobacterium crassostreae TaxID=1763534 RepID=A0A1B9E4S9_9FLAO|nr:pitrilysin family protein [Flavobacterium crassostreae]OCB76868.1 insulinase-like protein [Flavobacterium crassostreae]
MKTTIFLFILLLLAPTMSAQERNQPKPGKAPTVKINKPLSFVLANGLKVLVVENHKLPKVSFNLTIDNPPFAEGNKKGVDQLCSSLIGNGSRDIPKDTFNEEIDFLGANMSFSSHGAYASCLSKYAARILELMANGALYPNFTTEEFDKEKAKLVEGIKSQEKNVPAIANRVVDALAFGTNHPFGEYTTLETVNNTTLEDVKTNYNRHFAPDNAYLVVIGDIQFKEIKPTIEKLFGSWKKSNTTTPQYTPAQNVAFTQINFVDMPNASQSEVALVNTLDLKMSDPDFFPAVIATYILGGGFNSYLNMNLREKNGWTYGANTVIGAEKYVSKLKSASSIKTLATAPAVLEFITEIQRIRTEMVSEELLQEVKAAYVGRFVMQVQKPAAIARYALNIETEGLPKDFYENYIKNIDAVTPQEVLQAANKYFLINNTRIVIVGKGSEILSDLEKLGFPIYYFDRYSNPTEKPKYP